jgi:hypothetical protein
MSSLEENKQLARRWLELVGEGRLEELCAMTAPTWQMHGGPPQLARGPAGVRQLFATFGHIDQHWTVEQSLAKGNMVAVRATNNCLQDRFLGIASHGRRQLFTATFIFTIGDGQVLETWRNADDLGRLLQLGARIEEGDIASDLDTRSNGAGSNSSRRPVNSEERS